MNPDNPQPQQSQYQPVNNLPQQPIASQPVAQTPQPLPNTPKKKSNLVGKVLIILIILGLLLALGYIGYQNLILQKQIQTPSQTTPSPEASIEPTIGWITYTNNEYGFNLKHPQEYKQIQDVSGWPKSVIIISRENQQSYDLVAEVWGSKVEYETKYADSVSKYKVFNLKNGMFLTLLNINNSSEVENIIATFNLLDQPQSSPTAWKTFTSSQFVYQNSIYKSFSIEYPNNCTGTAESTLECKSTNGTYKLILNAGGHGGNITEIKTIKSNEPKTITAGQGTITIIEDVKAKTLVGVFWLNKTPLLTASPIFGVEFSGVPSQDLSTFEKEFDYILNSLKLSQ